MRVSVAVAQIPVCWSVSRNTATVVEIIDRRRTKGAFLLRVSGAR
jgi:hypothetical protein